MADDETGDWRREHPELADLPSDTVFAEPSADDPTPESTLHDLAPNSGRENLGLPAFWNKRQPYSPLVAWTPRSHRGRAVRRGLAAAGLVAVLIGVATGLVQVLRAAF